MNEYRKMEDLLDELYDIVSESKSGAFFGGKTLDKELVFNIIEDIRLAFPVEIKEAKKIITNAEKVIHNAEYEANKIIKNAEEYRLKLISEHEITKLVKKECEKMQEEAREYVREMRIGAVTYADKCLSNVEGELQAGFKELSRNFRAIEDIITTEINTIYKNRQELRENE